MQFQRSSDKGSVIKDRIHILHATILRFLHRRAGDTRTDAFLREFFTFGYKEAISCIFPVFIFGMLAITRLVSIPGIPRYDLLLIACLAMQWLMFRFGLETKEEVYIIGLFHALGLSMEIFKVSHNSWAYPDFGYSKVFDVPLYSGFMYASVASYICQAWRHFDLKIIYWPPPIQSAALGAAIYGNFYTNAYLPDVRIVLAVCLLIAFWKTRVYFKTNGNTRSMPMVVSFFLIALFIWLAENIGTFLGAWRYPHQNEGWSVVRVQILTSWCLLVIVSVIMVALIKRIHLFNHEQPERQNVLP